MRNELNTIRSGLAFGAAVAAVALGCCVVGAAPALAQDAPGKSLAQQEAERQVTQPLNNAPVWREVRSGVPQVTTVRGRETNVLIQPQGQTWRALRNGQVAIYGGWALVAVFLAIATFYAIKGTMPLHGRPTGHDIRRFTWFDRVVHWSTAITFSILAITGLIMFFGKSVLLPLVGHTLFAWLAILGKNLHNFVGPLFSVCLIVLLINFVGDNFPKAYDFAWIRHFGGLLGGREPASGKFNAGEKLWFWGGVCVLGIIVSASGFVLDFPNFDQTRETMQIANVIHSVGAILFMLGAMGHIYMGTLGMQGAYSAMRTGYVDEEWAREHHAYWLEEIENAQPDIAARSRSRAA